MGCCYLRAKLPQKTMALVSVKIPQIGEGLHEARLVAVLKQPGEKVRRDEPIYQMETDKAVMDVESPYDGTLVEWLANPDDILPIGGEVARMEVVEAVEEQKAPVVETQVEAVRRPDVVIPPRTRAYAKEKGLSDDQLAAIPAKGKLMPADIDAFLAGVTQKPYAEAALTGKQRLLSSRLSRGAASVVPGTISAVVDWSSIESARQTLVDAGGDWRPSTFTMFAFCVAKTLAEFPMFRSSLVGEDTLRTYHHAALGIAVTLPGDELVLAVIDDADTLDWLPFAQLAREKIELARTGKDQATEAVTLSITNMQSYGIRDAVPVVVSPSVATLFLGETHYGLDSNGQQRRQVIVSLTFDHRVINGVGAAEFVNKLKARVEGFSIEAG